MSPQFTTPITSLQQAQDFLSYLWTEGMSYHPEDSAADCIAHLVSAEEAQAIDKRMEEVYWQAWPEEDCPCSYLLSLDPKYRARMEEDARQAMQDEAEQAEIEAGWDSTP